MMTGRRLRKLATAAAVAFVATALAACSTPTGSPAGSGEPATGADGELFPMTVQATQLVMDAPIRAAIADGSFEAAGLDVTLDTSANSPTEALPMLLGGTLTISLGEIHNAMLGASQGMPLKVVAPVMVGTETAPGEMGFVNIMVRGDGSVNTPQDLVGKTLGVNGIGEQPWMQSSEALRMAGVDPTTVQFVAVPFQNQVQALMQGQVDAIVVPEPLGTIAMGEGAKQLMTVDNTWPDAARYAYITTADTAEQHTEQIAAFQDVILAKAAELNADHQLAIDTAMTYVEFPEELVSVMAFPTYATEPVTDEDIKIWGEQIVAAGLETDASKLPSADEILFKP